MSPAVVPVAVGEPQQEAERGSLSSVAHGICGELCCVIC